MHPPHARARRRPARTLCAAAVIAFALAAAGSAAAWHALGNGEARVDEPQAGELCTDGVRVRVATVTLTQYDPATPFRAVPIRITAGPTLPPPTDSGTVAAEILALPVDPVDAGGVTLQHSGEFVVRYTTPLPANANYLRYIFFLSADSEGSHAGQQLPIEDCAVGKPPKVTGCLGKTPTITGTAGADVIHGTPGADVIAGLGGNDTIDGRLGKDLICGGAGRDTLDGGGQGDGLDGGGGADALRGADGPDLLLGAGGRDELDGNAGTDILKGGEAADDLDGGADLDWLDGGPGTDGCVDGGFQPIVACEP